MSNLFTPVVHPRIELRKKDRPVKVADLMLRGGNPITRFNRWLAVKVTNAVGTMWWPTCSRPWRSFRFLPPSCPITPS